MSGVGDPSGPERAGAGIGSAGREGVCGIVVTYNPAPGAIAPVLRAAAAQVDHLVLLDNGSDPEAVEEIRRAVAEIGTSDPNRVLAHYYPSNRGLPIRFNEGLRLARAAGDGFALLLDQDSLVLPGTVRALREAYRSIAPTLPAIALEAVNVEPTRYPTDDFLAGYWRRRAASEGIDLLEDHLATNSGLFLPLEAAERVGGFDESYFLDAADFEFALRLRRAGTRILQVPNAQIQHQRGEPADARQRTRAFPFRPVRPVRHYYVARDVLRTWARYWRRFPMVGLLLLSMPVREAALVALYYPDRWVHFRFLWRGVLDALNGVGGPMPPPARSGG